jgi:flagellar motor protein MotB
MPTHYDDGRADDHQVEEEGYFVSMTDMMVGLVFIFMILVMYFALQVSQERDRLTSANQTRTDILNQLQAKLQDKGITVTLDTENGVLRLPDKILFESGMADLSADGVIAIGKLREALLEVLPCYISQPIGVAEARPTTCPAKDHRIESLYIEGHTDKDSISRPRLGISDNWDLSVKRATNTYRLLAPEEEHPLSTMCAKHGDNCAAILSVSGYGDRRPIATGQTEVDKQRNRRIDLRIVMITPDAGRTQREIESRIDSK